MSFLRNTFAVLLGLGVAMLIITIGLRINSEWITYSGFTPFKKWSRLLEDMRGNSWFFVALLISTGVASTIGGITTALIVKKAKVAYALGREHVDKHFMDVFNKIIGQIDSAETLHHAKLFYEAMLGFRKAQESK